MPKKTTLFVDIGGVFLTNGWDRHSRELAAEEFHLDLTELNNRHPLFFDTYEIGKITLDEYLRHVIFHQPRPFSPDAFKQFMLKQSQPIPLMIELIRTLKKQYRLKVVTVSNEGMELSDYRIPTYKLSEFVDIFIISGFVGMKKPDPDFYKLALDTAQVRPNEVLYIDDRLPFIELAATFGIEGIHHQTYEATAERAHAILARR